MQDSTSSIADPTIPPGGAIDTSVSNKVLHKPHKSPEPLRNGKSLESHKPREGGGVAKGNTPLRARPGITPKTSNGPLTAQTPLGEDHIISSSSRHLRLYNAAKDQQAKLDALRQKARDSELDGCSFRPQLIRSASASRQSSSEGGLTSTSERNQGQQPRFQRLYSDAEERQRRQTEAAKQQQLARAALTAKRSTTPLAKHVTTSFSDRMRESDQRISQHILTMKEEQMQRETKECTFRPKLVARPQSAGSRRLQSNKQQEHIPVHERLAAHAAVLQKKKEDAIAKAAEEEKHAFDFKPKLATSTSPSRPNGDNHVRSPDIYTRLTADAEALRNKKAALAESIEAEKLKECSFSPTIPTYHPNHEDPTISSISGGTSVFDRLSTPQHQHHYTSEETFQPKLNAKAQRVPDRRPPEEAALPVYDRLLMYGQKQKEQRIANEKKRLEEEQMECTFSPHITSTPDGNVWREDPEAALPPSRSSSPTSPRTKSPPPKSGTEDVFHRLHQLKTEAFSAKLVSSSATASPHPRGSASPLRGTRATSPTSRSADTISPKIRSSISPPPRKQQSRPLASPGAAMSSPKPGAAVAAFDPSKVIKRRPKGVSSEDASDNIDIADSNSIPELSADAATSIE